MLVAATTLAALLIAAPNATSVDRIAADSGFLLGNAHRCGIATDRILRAGRVVRQLIAAAAGDNEKDVKDEAALRFAKFFLVSAFPDPKKEKLIASCDAVTREFGEFERHQMRIAADQPVEAGSDTTGPPHYDPGAGE